MNRNHFFLLGLVILFAGLQMRFVQSYQLNNESSEFLAQRFGSAEDQPRFMMARSIFSTRQMASLRTVTPPQWIGWALLSIGSVLVLHALAMPKISRGE